MIKGNKIPCWLSILILIVLSPSAGPHEVLTQTREVARALDPILKRYEVVHLEPGSIERQVRTTGELRLQFEGTDLYFNLEPHDLRAAGYLAEATGPGGGRRTLPPQPVHTFKGKLAGREDTWGRFNLSGSGVEGIVHAPEGWYYLEPLRNYLPGAAAGDLVVYRHGDIKSGPSLTCGVLMPGRLEPVLDRVTAQVEADPPTNYVFEVATEADYEYVQALEGSAEANREILGILNQVEGVFQSELLLQLQVTFQHTWEKEDPYDNRDDGALLVDFRDYWNSHFAASKTYDIAHVWTGNRVPNLGVATGVVCRGGEKGYSLSMHEHDTFILRKYMTAAHEIGHNFGAVHPNELQPPIAGCTNTIMVPSYWKDLIVGNDDPLTFCEFSRQTIRNHVASYNSCLATQPITLQPPTGLTAAAVSTSGVELRWQDNSTNETGFLVFYRLDNSGDWIEIGATYANVTTFSQEGLLAGSTFRYRVRAFNGMETSAFSNEAVATTRAGRQAGSDWKIDTIAGGDIGDNGPANLALLNDPFDVAVDGAGNIYISDWGNARIRRVDSTGTITTVAGTGEHGNKGDGGPAVEAQLNAPTGLALDGAGNLYIADSGNHRIRRIDTEGIITTIAGTGERGNAGDGGPATRAKLNFPNGMALDGAGNLYFSDRRNHRVRRIDTLGTITTIAGSGGMKGHGGDGGPAVMAQLSGPHGLAVDGSGNLYIAETPNDRIRRVDTSGVITTVAGTGEEGHGGDGVPAVMAQLSSPHGLAVDGSGNLYIANTSNHRIRRVDTSGVITTVAGIGKKGYSGDGPAAAARMYHPEGLTVDGAGNLYIADNFNNRIRRVDPAGNITTIAGAGDHGYGGDSGSALQARLYWPSDVAVDKVGNVYVADTQNHRIRVLTQSRHPPGAPTRLRATAVSVDAINLAWQDNSGSETAFGVQRRVAGAARWVEIATTATDVNTFSDTGLKPTSTYHYRVRAFNYSGASTFSNEASATTLEAFLPTLTRFTPTSGPAGTWVTMTGTHFLGASDVRFNGVSSLQFEIVSMTTIRAVVPPGATSGPISVVTPGGTGISAEPFTVTTGLHSRLFIPIVLRSQGRTPASLFTAELTLTNRGTTTAAVHHTYTVAFGGGSGTAVDSLEPGRQRVIPDAIGYLTALGVPIGSGSAGGTLLVDFSNLSSPSATAVTVRVTTPVEEGSGSAGLAFPGLNPDGLLTGPAFIAGLRHNTQDRSNLAVQNAGVGGEESVTLRVTVYSGDPEAPGSLVLPDLSLPPGGFHQYNGILNEAGFENGYVKVERVEGEAPFYAYGVINDQVNSDGSFVFPVTAGSLEGRRRQTLPVIVETSEFSSELTVTNFSGQPRTLDFEFVSEHIQGDEKVVGFQMELAAGEQVIVPEQVAALRREGVAGLGRRRGVYLGPVFVMAKEGDLSGVVIGARTGSKGGGGTYSVFYNAVPDGEGFDREAWVEGLQQNEENRSNLALVNTGEVDDSPSVFRLEIYNGETGTLEDKVVTKPVPARGWLQVDGILLRASPETKQGYIRIEKMSGENPFLAYGVVNDGGAPGERSGDGAYLPARE